MKANANDFSYIQKILDSENLENLVDKFLEDGESIGVPLFTSEEIDKILQEGTGSSPITKKRRLPGYKNVRRSLDDLFDYDVYIERAIETYKID